MGGGVNYFERHLGDYARDTGHLTMLEHGAYTLLMDRYYASEAGIPADQAHRVARARTREERAAVDAVLSEFFALADGAWTHGRIEQELTKARTRIEAARTNGRSGGRPKRNPEVPDKKPTGLSPGSVSETQIKALHLTKHQAPEDQDKEKARALLESFAQDPRLLTLREQGATDEDLLPIAAEAVAKGKGGAWIAAALVGRRADAAALALAPAVPISVARDPDAAERSRAYLDELASIKSTPPTPEFLALLRSVRTA